MKASYQWLCSLVPGLEKIPACDLAQKLTFSGLEVEGILDASASYAGIVVGEVIEKDKHPNADKLSVCRVSDGKSIFQVVCGAPNVTVGKKYPLATLGTVMSGGLEIKPVSLRGVESSGMLCSSKELNLPTSGAGLLELPPEFRVGEPIAKALGLDDVIFEINVTPNRGDALSHWGLAREISALTGLKVSFEVDWPVAKKTEKAAYRFSHVDKLGCSRFTTSQIFGVRVAPSPTWLARRVESLGMRSINNIVDATNYVMLLTGHPVHAYDAARLAGPALAIQSLSAAKKFVTLDGLERSLDVGDLVISDAQREVGLAGIMGGQNSEILDSTQNVILEVAHFEASFIRKTARRLGIKTESSYRFERFVNPETVLEAHTILQSLIVHVAGGAATEILDSYPKPWVSDEIILKADLLEKTLGYVVPETQVESILVGLGCRIKKEKIAWQVTVPLARSDLKRPIDLVEEVARINGLDKIPTVLPPLALHSPKESEASRFSFVIKDYLVGQGFLETVHYSFTDVDMLKTVLNTQDDSSWIRLSNPIAEDLAVMRPSLLPGLLAAYQKNQIRSETGLRLFELRRVYSRHAQGQISETNRLGFLLSGNIFGRNPFELSRTADFFDAKGFVQNILRYSRLDCVSRPVVDWPYHPAQAVGFFCGEKVLVRVGALHPQLLQSLKIKERLFYADFDFDALSALAVQRTPRYEAVSSLPPVYRDMALVVDEAITHQNIVDAINGCKPDFLIAVSLFDVYVGENLPAGKKSLAYSMVYEPKLTSLTDEQVNAVHFELIGKLKACLGAELR